jgi:ribosomal protein S13
VVLLYSFLNINASEIIEQNEKLLIYDLLERNNFDSTSVNFLKDWSSDTKFKLPIVVDVINNPMHFPLFVSRQEELIQTEDFQLMINEFSDILFDDKEETNLEYSFSDIRITRTKDIFHYIQNSWELVDKIFQEAFEDLSQEELQKLIYLAYMIPMEDQDADSYEEFFQHNQLEQYDQEIEDYVEIIEKVNFPKLTEAFKLFHLSFNELVIQIQDFRFKNKKILTKETKFGTLCIGTSNTDIYDQDYSFILDPGGNDQYTGPLNANWKNNLFWSIDLGGNDIYMNQQISGLFSAVFGLSLHLDLNGDDVYRGNDHTMSASFGCNCILDRSGDDIYDAGLHSLGAATFGITILDDDSGNDIYSVTEFGQGYAGTLAIGLLSDRSGNDLYYAGGKYLHKPLAPLDYRSLSQGFGYGLRPDLAGGIGILYDENGNDRYNGGVYSQAVAYWYALGILIDEKGNDFYSAVYYPQGSGIHLAGGFLFDREGEDHYYSKHGPGQGAGHDYAVGFLVDREGDDSYSIEGGNGLGLTNSVGIFLDVSGKDRYERSNLNSYGFANEARDSGGLGIFLDTGGEDSYPNSNCSNDSTWINGIYGLGIDTLMVLPVEKVKEMAKVEAAQIDSLAAISEIFSIASQWGVGSAAKRVEKAGEILLKRDVEAAEYIFETQLGTKSGLVYRALKNFVKGSSTFQEYIPNLLIHQDSLWVKNTMSLIGDMNDSTYVDTLKKFVDKKLYLKTALSALGRIKSDKSTEILKNFRLDVSEKIRVITARGLKNIGTPLSHEYLVEMEMDNSFLIQTMIRLLKENNK